MKWKRSKKAQQDNKKDHHLTDEKKTNKEQPDNDKAPTQMAADLTAVKSPMLDRDRIIALERERAMAAANFNSNHENRRMGLNQDGRPMDMFRPYVV